MTNPMTKTDWTAEEVRKVISRHYLPVEVTLTLLAFANRIAEPRATVMSAEYSVNDFNSAAENVEQLMVLGAGEKKSLAKMLRWAAERIKADESAVPVAVVSAATLKLGAPAWPGQLEGKSPPEGWVQLSVAAEPPAPAQEQPGWKWVPVEPTEAMMHAAMQREDDEPLTDWGKIIAAPMLKSTKPC